MTVTKTVEKKIQTTPHIVYQVRAIDPHGKKRIVHSYESVDAAKKAIQMMKAKTKARYDFIAIENQPHMHWGINPHVK